MPGNYGGPIGLPSQQPPDQGPPDQGPPQGYGPPGDQAGPPQGPPDQGGPPDDGSADLQSALQQAQTLNPWPGSDDEAQQGAPATYPDPTVAMPAYQETTPQGPPMMPGTPPGPIGLPSQQPQSIDDALDSQGGDATTSGWARNWGRFAAPYPPSFYGPPPVYPDPVYPDPYFPEASPELRYPHFRRRRAA